MTELIVAIGVFTFSLIIALVMLYRVLIRIEALIMHKFDDGFVERFDAVYDYIKKEKNYKLEIKRGKVKKVMYNRNY